MSPELELLDQLLGGPMSLAVLRRLFSSQAQFQRAVEAMINDDMIRLVDADGVGIPQWQWESNRAEGNNWKLEITKKGIDRIEGKERR